MTAPKLPARIEHERALAHTGPEPSKPGQRWGLFRDIIVFQIKLVVDGLKDFVLGPLSMITGAIDLARDTPESKSLFRSVLRAGARFDRWVGLFDAIETEATPSLSAPPPNSVHRGPAEPSLDNQLLRLERVLSEQVQRGGLTASAKQAIERALERIETQPGRARSNTESPAQPHE